MQMTFPEARNVIRRIEELAQVTSPVVVALDGRSGTGKSTVSTWLAEHLGGTRVDQDDFYTGGDIEDWRRLTPSQKADRVIDWERVRTEVLLPLREGSVASWHPFDWETMAGLAPEVITAQPSKVVILDGAYSTRPQLADLIDLSVLVVLDDAVRRERLRQREGEDYASSWHQVWDEAEDWYFTRVRPPETFDLVIERPSCP
jgi:uridine kinase